MYNCKNDAKRIEKCLSSIRAFGFEDEIIVVDTGSTDNTVEVCKKYSDSVLFFEWVNDFAKAKNYAIENASNPYVLVLDSDEYIEKIDIEKVWFLSYCKRKIKKSTIDNYISIPIE